MRDISPTQSPSRSRPSASEAEINHRPIQALREGRSGASVQNKSIVRRTWRRPKRPSGCGRPSNVRFGSKAYIAARPCNVRFAPNSRHQTGSRQVWRSSSGSFAMYAAIRRASSFVSSLAADRRPGHSHNVCGGSSSNLSLAVNIAIRRSASSCVRLGLNASSS